MMMMRGSKKVMALEEMMMRDGREGEGAAAVGVRPGV